MPPSGILLVDANLLVLLVVGLASPEYIARHKRLRAFGAEDFDLLRNLLAAARRVIVTPNVVTEASNLAGQIAEPARARIFAALRTVLEHTQEVYVESRKAAVLGVFPRLGIADAVTLDLLGNDMTLVTSDLDLYLEAARQGRDAVNFNHFIAANR
jgi:hypothetical protein